jgi:hypothetical protein
MTPLWSWYQLMVRACTHSIASLVYCTLATVEQVGTVLVASMTFASWVLWNASPLSRTAKPAGAYSIYQKGVAIWPAGVNFQSTRNGTRST